MESADKRIESALKRRYGTGLPAPAGLAHADAIAAMNERSVCRNYRNEPVAEDLLTIVCATALSAPSKSDLQQADIVRVRSPEKRAAIHALMPRSAWIASAPEFLVICGDNRRMRHLFSVRGSAFPNDHLDSFFNAAVDGAIVLATLVQAAHLAGLGTCPISEIRDHAPAISELLELPQWVFPVAGLTLGYPVSLEPLSPRLGLGATLHVDRYDAGRVAADIEEYDARRIRERPYRRQRDPQRFGEASAYGWSEEKFRHYSDVYRAGFGAYVRQSGFKLD